MKIAVNDKIQAVILITKACASGARKFVACRLLMISLRTIQRWEKEILADKRKGADKKVIRKLSEEEEQEIIAICCSEKYKDMNPHEIVPDLAENGVYIASESTFYRVLRKKGLLKHRSNRKPGKKRGKPPELKATGPDQVWCWDITYLKSSVSGIYFYCYMIKDIWTKEIVGWAVHDIECGELAEELFKSLVNKYDLRNVHLHSDNGGPMKKASLLVALYDLGVMPSFSRPRVSNDNPYIESLFSTMKYKADYPKSFKDIETARDWIDNFVNWYNNEHRHSAIGYVTPGQRRLGHDKKLFVRRNETMKKAREKHPERWGNKIKKWEVIKEVYLNKADNKKSDDQAA